MSVHQALKYSYKTESSALEFAAGVPASIGGMVAMNFGCWGKQMSDIVISVHALNEDGEEIMLTNKQCMFNYRTSIFQQNKWIILSVSIKRKKESTEKIKGKVMDYVKERNEKQPMRTKTFGSIFKNPNNYTAAQLIESCGLKGFTIGGVKISNQHANFLENVTQASYEDIKLMVSYIQEKVEQKHQVFLTPEVKFLT